MSALEVRHRVLIIEDDENIASLEETVLQRAGYLTRVANTGRDGLASVDAYRPDVVLVDIGLPDMSGLDVCTAIAGTADAYILMVSAHSGETIRLRGLSLGADDFITKPFSGRELVARVASFLRRRERTWKQGGGRLKLGDVTLVRDHHSLECGARAIPLTALEFRLIWYLGESNGRLLTRAQILERVWNDVSGVPTRVVDVHVAALRKKLGDVGASLQIASVRGIGYRLDPR